MNPILQSLNAAQRAAVEVIDGPLMTLAGPGSGKTRVVTHRIAYMIDQGISPTEILAMTFTNKASREMQDRVARLVGNRRIAMGTFHGFGAKFLRRYGRYIGLPENFSIYDPDDAHKALERAIIDSNVKLTHLSVGDIAREISRLKNNLVTPEMMDDARLNALGHVVYQVYPRYQSRLLQSSAVDFDDLIYYPSTILRNENELRADLDRYYRYILVDEYQDTNNAQYMLIRLLSSDNPNINVTGDPDQSIYGWRGANIENILRFEKDFAGTKVVRLEQNYRSTPEILSIADSLIHHNRRRKEKVLIATRESGVKVRLVSYSDDREEAEHIADQIASAIIDLGERPKDFAVLYRTNAQSRLLEQALVKRRINYQLIGGFKFYQRQEIKDLLCYLRLVQNGNDDVAFARIVNTPPRGLGDKSLGSVQEVASRERVCMLEALARVTERNGLAKKALSGAKDFLLLYSQLVTLSSGSLVALIDHLVKQTGYVEYLAKKKTVVDDEQIDANILELMSDAKQVDQDFGDDQPLQIFLEQVSLLSDQDRLADDPDRVTLMTMHASKGLEFPSVFIIAVEQDILPHVRSKDDSAQLEEERRLFFVGITRAQDRLQLSIAYRRGFQGRSSIPSGFLMELPRLEMEIADMSQRLTPEEYEYVDRDDDRGESADTDNDSNNFDSFTDDVVQVDAVDSEAEATDFDPTDFDPAGFDTDSDTTREHAPSKSFARRENSNQVQIPVELERKLGRIRRLAPMRLKTASKLEPVMTASGMDVQSFVPGTRAMHPSYGAGVIISVDGFGMKRRAVVQFEIGETKTFVLSSSPLRIDE